MLKRLMLAGAATALLTGCGGQSSLSGQMSAEIRRTAFGVPHVKAVDYTGLGFGLGYAMAEDNLCEILDRQLTVSGERAKYLGPGEDNANILSDLYHRRLIASGEMERLLNGPADSIDTPSSEARALARGYAAGVSRYVRDRGTETITDPRCRGAAWVRELTEEDYWRHQMAGQVIYQLAGVASATPPGLADEAQAPDDPLIETTSLGSNALALGREATQSGMGALLGNPHYPWDGQNRFYRMHMTIPGKLNVVGAGLVTNASVGIGHTEHVAWTHTVSTARRYGIFELSLDPADPTRYFYDGVSQPMQRTDVTIEVKDSAPVTHTFYTSRFGPIVETKTFPWSSQKAYAIRTIPQGLRSPDQYLAMWQAKNVRELYAALQKYQATGFNTTAVDAGGEAFFGDMGMVPNVSQELADRCARSDLAKQQWTDNRIPVLDGSTSECEWTTDPDSTAPGVFGASRTPALFRNDYVSQMNDSHWLTNPGAPMTGYSPVFGDEGTVRSLRTRLGLDIVRKRISGADGLGEAKFTLASLQASLFQNRHLGAELVRDDLVGACRASGQTSLRSACEALAAWDLRVDLDSRGAHLFHLFAENGGLQFKTPFDPADPLSTPNTLDTANPKVLEALQTAVARLGELSIPVDATLGEVQAETRGAERIPIHGGAGPEGVFNVITVDSLEAEQGWTSIRHGSSWIMTVEFTPEGPRSQGILTYSQSTDPTSPFYSDQTRAYSGKQWDDLLFTEAAVEAATVSRQSLSE